MKGEPDLLATYENRFQQEIARLKNRAKLEEDATNIAMTHFAQM